MHRRPSLAAPAAAARVRHAVSAAITCLVLASTLPCMAAGTDMAVLKQAAEALADAPPDVTALVTYTGHGINSTHAFLAVVDDVIAESTDFISVDDLTLTPVSFSPCGADGSANPPEGVVAGAPAPAPAPTPAPAPAPGPSPPPPGRRRAARRLQVYSKKCTPSLDVSVEVRRNGTLTQDQVAAVRAVLAGPATVKRVRSDGVDLQSATLLQFDVRHESVNDPSGAAGAAAAGSDPVVGKDTVVFRLMLVGPAASVSNTELIRTLHSLIVANLTAGPVDYLRLDNTRVTRVARTPSFLVVPHNGGAGGAAAGMEAGISSSTKPAARRRLAQMLVGALPSGVVPNVTDGDADAPVPATLPPPHLESPEAERAARTAPAPLPPPPQAAAAQQPAYATRIDASSQNAARMVSSNLPGGIGSAEPVPAIDVAFEARRLPRSGTETLYTQLAHAVATNSLTSAMLEAGWNINAVSDAMGTFFTVNGKPYGESGNGGGPEFLTVRGGKGTDPGIIATATIVPALVAAGLAAVGWVAYKRSGGGGSGGGGGGGGLGGGAASKKASSAAATLGLADAVAAATRAGSAAAPSAAALFGIDGKGIGGGGESLTSHSATADSAGGGDRSSHGGGGGSSGPDYQALAVRDWQLDPAALRILTRPDGSEWELGSGASGRVYKALLHDAQEVAVKVFLERLPLAAAPEDGGGGGRGDVESVAATPRAARRRSSLGGFAKVPLWLARLRSRSPTADRPLSRDDTAEAGGGRAAAAGGSVGRVTSVSDPAGSVPSRRGGLPARTTSRSDPARGTAAALTTSQARRGAELEPSPSIVRSGATPRRVPLIEELAREVLLLRACHDRNIVSFVGASIQAGHAVLVTEFMHNGDLFAALAADDKDRFTWRRRLAPSGKPVPGTGMNRQVALDIVRGLHFLHARRIAHLDLKSANILLGRDYTAKIADVGLSKILRDRHVSTMHAVGTYAWAAPEVLMGEPTGTEADIYSFGVILHELSVREPPAGRRLRPVSVPDEAPRSVVALMERCLSPDPAARPTALELVHFFVDLGRKGSGSGSGTTCEVVGGDGGAGPPGPTPPPAERAGGGGWLGQRLSRKGSSISSEGGDGAAAAPLAAGPPRGFGGGGGGAPPPAVPPPSGFGAVAGGGGGGAVPPPSGFGAPPPAPAVRRATGGPPPKGPDGV